MIGNKRIFGLIDQGDLEQVRSYLDNNGDVGGAVLAPFYELDKIYLNALDYAVAKHSNEIANLMIELGIFKPTLETLRTALRHGNDVFLTQLLNDKKFMDHLMAFDTMEMINLQTKHPHDALNKYFDARTQETEDLQLQQITIEKTPPEPKAPAKKEKAPVEEKIIIPPSINIYNSILTNDIPAMITYFNTGLNEEHKHQKKWVFISDDWFSPRELNLLSYAVTRSDIQDETLNYLIDVQDFTPDLITLETAIDYQNVNAIRKLLTYRTILNDFDIRDEKFACEKMIKRATDSGNQNITNMLQAFYDEKYPPATFVQPAPRNPKKRGRTPSMIDKEGDDAVKKLIDEDSGSQAYTPYWGAHIQPFSFELHASASDKSEKDIKAEPTVNNKSKKKVKTEPTVNKSKKDIKPEPIDNNKGFCCIM